MSYPIHPPHYYQALVEASYEPFPYKGIESKCEAEVLSRQQVNKWRIILVRKDAEIAVVFPGTNPFFISNLVDDLWNHFDSNTALIEELESWMRYWEKHQGKINVFVGHSAGGYYAARVWKNDDTIFRVTFNAHGPICSDRSINLFSETDPLQYSTRRHVCKSKKCMTVVKGGGHAIASFAKPIKKYDNWTNLQLAFSHSAPTKADIDKERKDDKSIILAAGGAIVLGVVSPPIGLALAMVGYFAKTALLQQK